jgi:Flp pilus assembly pilin Flp
MQEFMTSKHRGAFAFEYIIVLVIMAVAIFTAWKTLATALTSKASDLSAFIGSNGQTALGGGA